MEKKRTNEQLYSKNLSLNEQIINLKREIKDLQYKNYLATQISDKDNHRLIWQSEFFDSMPEAAFSIDSNSMVLNANKMALQLFGYSITELHNDEIILMDLIQPEKQQALKNILHQLFNGNNVANGIELTLQNKKGSSTSVLCYFKPLYENGKIIGANGLMVDFSSHKKAEEVLISAKEFAELIYNVTPSAIFTVDRNKVITSWNRMAEEITGYAAFEALGKKCFLFTESPCNEACGLFDGREYETYPLVNECTIRTKSGEKRIIKKNCDYLRNKSGEVIGGIESFEDITQQKNIMRELIDSKEQAEESDRLKSSFLANMSHEIRTPVNGIVGFAELLKEPALSFEEREEFLSIIKQSGNQLLTLVNDIIDISKIEANQLNINKENFSLNLLLEELQKLFKRQIEKAEKKVELRLVKGLSSENDIIHSDPYRLRQVLINLLSNAVKFTERGEIIFGYKILDDTRQIEFFVKDSGVGIPKSQQDFIFERFAQISSREGQNRKGTGLGLAISKGILDLLGGTITVRSKPGFGACFTFQIPFLHVNYCKIKKNKKQNIMNYNWSDKTLLIVEDDHINYKYLEILLVRTKVRVLRAMNGQQAVDLCQEYPEIDAVLMDIQLPVLNGYQATRKIKTFRNELPIIAQTANAMDDDKDKCLEAGCDDYLTKPISHEVLFELLERIFSMKFHVSED